MGEIAFTNDDATVTTITDDEMIGEDSVGYAERDKTINGATYSRFLAVGAVAIAEAGRAAAAVVDALAAVALADWHALAAASSAGEAAVSEASAATREANAAASETAAAVSATEAAGYAAGLNMPGVGAGDAHKLLRVNAGETGYEVTDILPAVTVAGAMNVDGNKLQNVGQSYGAVAPLTDDATITPNFAVANNFSVTLAGNRTLANPTGLQPGQSGSIIITQDATGSRTLSFGAYWKFSGGTAPTLTTTAGAKDVLSYLVESADRISASLLADTR